MQMITNDACLFINFTPHKMLHVAERVQIFEDSVVRLMQLLAQRTRRSFRLLIVIYDTVDFDIAPVTQRLSLPNNVYIRKFVVDTDVNPFFGCSEDFRGILREFMHI